MKKLTSYLQKQFKNASHFRAIYNLQRLFESNPTNEKSGNSLFKKASTLRDGDTGIPFTDNWAYAIKYPRVITDYAISVGRAQINAIGDFILSRQGDEITVIGKVNYSLSDKFDFNPGEIFPLPVSPFHIKADDLNILIKCKGEKYSGFRTYLLKDLGT